MMQGGLGETMARVRESGVPARRLLMNVAFATRPRFVIIGTGRSGTAFISEYFRRAGVLISHEQYYTHKGPYLRNPWRYWRTQGDASWLAVPFLPDRGMVAIHQVRHPYKVIDSLFRIGFFDPAHDAAHAPFVAFARQHFRFSDDPLQSALRWYVEWNERCEAITDRRYRIEDLHNRAADIEQWLGLRVGLPGLVSDRVNSRPPVVDMAGLDVARDIRRFPEFRALEAMAERYGYDLPEPGA